MNAREVPVLLKDWDETQRNWANPGARGEKLRFFDFPAYHLMGLAGLAKQGMVHKYLEPWGLSMPEWRLLSTVAECSPIRFSRIAQLTAMDKAQVSRALRTAQGKGFVEAGILPVEMEGQAGKTTSARRVHVSITAGGREIFNKVMPAVQRDQLRLVELMSPEERHMMLKVAQRLFTQLQGELTREPATRTYRPEVADTAGAELRQAG